MPIASFQGLVGLLALLLTSACASLTPPCTPPAAGPVVYVVEQGWHAEIGLPIEELGVHQSFFRAAFPGARVIMFGYGKKTFFTAPATSFSEYILGPFPGTAVIHAVGLRVMPTEAYPPDATVTLALTPSGANALANYVWDDLSQEKEGVPNVVSHSTNPPGVFYLARSRYNLMHTCNSWTAETLHAAGLPVSDQYVSFSGQVMSRVQDAAAHQCPKPQ